MAKKIIIIDPGHFASTAGKSSPDNQLKEYKWTYMMAERLKSLLIQYGYDARLTITKSQSESTTQKDYLTNRAKTANAIYDKDKNCIFVSIHINAAGKGGWSTAKGWSVFVAANKDGKITGSKNSQRLADCMFDAVKETGKFHMRTPAPNHKFWVGNFTVLTATKMPAVLLENLFMDNKEEVKMLMDQHYQNILVSAWFRGLMRYMEEPNDMCPCNN